MFNDQNEMRNNLMLINGGVTNARWWKICNESGNWRHLQWILCNIINFQGVQIARRPFSIPRLRIDGTQCKQIFPIFPIYGFFLFTVVNPSAEPRLPLLGKRRVLNYQTQLGIKTTCHGCGRYNWPPYHKIQLN